MDEVGALGSMLFVWLNLRLEQVEVHRATLNPARFKDTWRSWA